jgi:hypothetical protein
VYWLLKVNHGYYPFPDGGGRDRPNDTEGPTVDEVILAWWKDAERRLGENSKELKQYRYALKPLRALYDSSPAEQGCPTAHG